MFGEKPNSLLGAAPLGEIPNPQSLQPMQSQTPKPAAAPKIAAQPAMDDPNREISIDEFDDVVADKYGIPRNLFRAMTKQESGGDPNAVSPTGVRGRQQVTERVAKSYNLNRNDPFEQSVAAGRYLREQFDALKDAPGFKSDDERWIGGLSRYYGGPSAVDRDGVLSDKSIDGVSNPAEHVERVARFWAKLNNGESLDDPSPAPVRQLPAPVTPAPTVAPMGKQAKPITTRGPVLGPQASPFSLAAPTGFQSAVQSPELGQLLPAAAPKPPAPLGMNARTRPTLEQLPQSNDPRMMSRWEQKLVGGEYAKSLKAEKARAQAAEKLRIEEEASRVPNLYGMGEMSMRFGRGLAVDFPKTLVQTPLMANRDPLSAQVREDLGRPIEEFGRKYFPVDERNPATMNPLTGGFWTGENLGKIMSQNLPQAAGSMLPFIAVGGAGGVAARLVGGAEAAGAALGGSRLASLAGRVGIGTVEDLASSAAVSGLGSAQGVMSGYEAAKAAGLTEDEARMSGMIEGFLGMLEGVGSPGSKGKFVKSALANIPKEARGEFIQEAFSQLGQGLNAAYLTGYDKNKGIGDIFGEALGAGALGGVLGGGAAVPGVIAETRSNRRAMKSVGAGAAPEAAALTPGASVTATPLAPGAAPSPAVPKPPAAPPLPQAGPVAAAPLDPNSVRLLQPGELQTLTGDDYRAGAPQKITVKAADGSDVELDVLVPRGMRPEKAQIKAQQAYLNPPAATPVTPAPLQSQPTASAPTATGPIAAADAPTAELSPKDRKNRNIITARQAAIDARNAFTAAMEASDFDGAEGALIEQRQYLKDLKSLIGKSQNSGDVKVKGQIERELGEIGNAMGQVRKARQQAAGPAVRALRKQEPAQTSAQESPLLSQAVNPEGGVPKLQTAPTDFNRLADRQELKQDNRLADKNILARIRELGGINTAGEYSGELQSAIDKRYPGLVKKKTGQGIKPDRLREMLRDDGYEVGEDLDSLFKAIDRGVAGEQVRPLDRRMDTGEMNRGQSYSDYLRSQEAPTQEGADDIAEFLRLASPMQRQGPQAAPTSYKPKVEPLGAPSKRLRQSEGLRAPDTGRLPGPSGRLEARPASKPLGPEPLKAQRPMSAMEQARAELPEADRILIERAMKGMSERPGPGQGVSFSPYADLVSNNREAVKRLMKVNLNAAQAQPAIGRIRKFALDRKIENRHVEALFDYIRNYQSDRARFQDLGVNPSEALRNPPTSELREFYSKQDQAPPPATKKLQHDRFGEVELVSKAPSGKLVVRDSEGDLHTIQNPRTTGNQSASYVRSESRADAPKAEAKPAPKPEPKKTPAQRLRDAMAAEFDSYNWETEQGRADRERDTRATFESLSNEELDGVLDTIQEDLNRDVSKMFMTGDERRTNKALIKIGKEVRNKRAINKQIESRASQRRRAEAEKEASEWAGTEWAEDAEDFKADFGRYPKDMGELRRGRPKTGALPDDAPEFVQKAAERLRDVSTGKTAGSGAQALFDQAIVTGYKFYKAGMDFRDWAKAVIKEVGPTVRPQLRKAWEALSADRQAAFNEARNRQTERAENLEGRETSKAVRSKELGNEREQLERSRAILRDEAKANQAAGRPIPDSLRKSYQQKTTELGQVRKDEARNTSLRNQAAGEAKALRVGQVEAAKSARADELGRKRSDLEAERRAILADQTAMKNAGKAIPERLTRRLAGLDREIAQTRKDEARNVSLRDQARIDLGWKQIEEQAEREQKLTPERRKANLERFLKGSQIKEPVYHGTFSQTPIEKIDPKRYDDQGLYGPGFYTTTSADVAGGEGGYGGMRETVEIEAAKKDPRWASAVEEFEGYMPNKPKSEIEEMAALDLGYTGQEAGQVYKLYARITNPFNAEKTYSAREATKLIRGLNPSATVSGEMRGDELYAKLENAAKGDKARVNAYLKQSDFDGITHVGRDGKGGQVWIAFEPNQVKSATSNRGTFSSFDPTIMGGGLFGLGSLQSFRGKKRPMPTGQDLVAWKSKIGQKTNKKAEKFLLERVDQAVEAAEKAANAGDVVAWNKFSREAERFARWSVQPSMRGRFFDTIGGLTTVGMLGTPGFVFRNVLGHGIYGAQSAIADRVAAGIDRTLSAVTKSERTIIGGPLNPIKGLREDWEGYKAGFKKERQKRRQGQQPGNVSSIDIPLASTIVGEKVNDVMWVINNLPDAANYEAHFQRSFRSIMAANAKAGRLSPEDELRAIDQAEVEADYATFKDENSVSRAAETIKKLFNYVSYPITGTMNFGLGDIVLKFTKTPANIAARTIEYSPIGALYKAAKFTSRARQGDPFAKRQAIQAIARGITGSATGYGMGYLLASLGLLVAPDDDDMSSEMLEAERGIRGYNLNLSALPRVLASLNNGNIQEARQLKDGDWLAPVGWAAPWAVQAAIGAAVYKKSSLMKATKDSYETLAKALEVMGDQSVFANLGDYFDAAVKGAKRADKGDEYTAAAEQVAAKILSSAVQSTAPGILRLAGRAIDPYTRDYRPDEKSGVIKSALDEGLSRAVAGWLPGLSTKYPTRTSAITGEPRKTIVGEYGPFARSLSAFLPFMPSTFKDSPLAAEILRLNELNDPAVAKELGEKPKPDVSLYAGKISPKEADIPNYVEPTSQLRGRENAFAKAVAEKGNRLVTSPGYKYASNLKKLEMLSTLIKDESEKTKESVKPQLMQQKRALPKEAPKPLRKPGADEMY